MLVIQAALLASMQEHSGGSSVATEASIRGVFSKYDWVPCGGKAPLSQWFSDGVVLLSVSSVGLILLVWLKISIGWVILLSSTSATLYICWISWMWPSSYGVLAKLVGEFSGESTYSELPSLSPELASDVTALSGLVVSLVVAVLQSVGHARFEFFCRSRWTMVWQCWRQQSWLARGPQRRRRRRLVKQQP